MATTTTIDAAKDNYLDEGSVGSNRGTQTYIYLGAKYRAGVFTKYNAIFEFDVSSFTNATEISSAVLTLEYISSMVATTTQTVTLARLNESFNETSSNWNDSSTAINWTGGSGAWGNAEATEATYTFSVGSGVSEDVTIDIKDLVVDAITSRSGTLLLIASVVGLPMGGGNGFTKFNSTEAIAGTCSIDVVVADRIVWDGSGGDGDLSNASNWVGDVAPTSGDHAIFSNGSVDVTTGALNCDTISIGRKYTGSISGVSLIAKYLNITTRANLVLGTLNSGQSFLCQVRVNESADLSMGGKFDITITKSVEEIDLSTGDVTRIDAHGRNAWFTASDEVATVRCTGSRATMEDGSTGLIACDGARVVVEATTTVNSNITTSNSIVRINAEEINDLVIYSGIVLFKDNVGAPIEVGQTKIYKNATLDARTNGSTFSNDSGDNINLLGGKLLLDGSTKTTIT